MSVRDVVKGSHDEGPDLEHRNIISDLFTATEGIPLRRFLTAELLPRSVPLSKLRP